MNKKAGFLIQIAAIIHWLVFLQGCDTRAVPYLLAGTFGSIACYKNTVENRSFRINRESVIMMVSSAVFSCMTASANYDYLSEAIRSKGLVSRLCDQFYVLMVFLGGFFAAWNILLYLSGITENFSWRQTRHTWPARRVFAVSLVVISAVDIFILFAGYYPGNCYGDSYSSIEQGLHDDYSNHHPFYYTIIVKLFIQLGLRWFHDINAAVAVYSVFQILFMAACLSYVVMTLYQLKISTKIILLCWFWYVGMPFHIMYSFTMWKDTIFGGCVAVFVTAMFRVRKKVGEHVRTEQILLVLGGLGICLFRSNGMAVFFLTFLCFWFLFGEEEKNKRSLFLFMAVLMFAFILKYPVQKDLGVRQQDAIEALSVPAQQIAKVIRDCDDIPEEYIELLRRIVDVDQVPDTYTVFISDPIKELVRASGDQDYLVEHKAEYFMLYLDIGMSHLDKYFEAWIDLTKGYWNGGYQYWVWLHKLYENDLGIERTVYLEPVHDAIEEYIWNYYDSPVLQIFLSIGFHMWIILMVAVLCMIRKDKEGFFLTVPLICILLTLLITVPVYAEFRYVYAAFCCIPLLLIAPFYRADDAATAVLPRI